MTHILALEKVSPAGIEALRAVPGFEIQELYQDDPEAVRSALATAEALIVRSKTKVTGAFLEQAPQLKVIGRPGTGVDNVDVKAATARGIVVMNTPAGNSISAAEHALGLMFALLRKIPMANNSMKDGKWEKSKFMGAELYNKVLGVVGLGKIGSEVAKRAQGFKVRILVYDPFVSEDAARDQNVTLVSKEELFAQSDIISLHTPLTQETRKMINATSIAGMKNGAYIVNAARGDLIDEKAFVEALKSGKLAGAALDVFTGEPKPNPELIALPNVIATPHIAASTFEAQEKVGYDIALQIRDFFQEGVVRNAVNFPSVSQTEYRGIAPYLDLGKKLGALLTQLSQGRMQEIEVRYFGELKDMNTHLICTYILAGALQPVMAEPVTPVNALQTSKDRGIHFVESSSGSPRNYSSLISVKLITDKGREWAEGTVIHHSLPRLVSLYGIGIDAPLSGDMLVIRNEDTPGVIGGVGTILGKNKINIANFAYGRKEETHEAIGVANVDSAIPKAVLEEIRALQQISKASIVSVTGLNE
jgi:D-3-phosphoglycerate dehydrogenase